MAKSYKSLEQDVIRLNKRIERLVNIVDKKTREIENLKADIFELAQTNKKADKLLQEMRQAQ